MFGVTLSRLPDIYAFPPRDNYTKIDRCESFSPAPVGSSAAPSPARSWDPATRFLASIISSAPAARPTGLDFEKASALNFFHADLRSASDFESLPACEFVIDAAANPSVLAGVDGRTSSRQLVEHNLAGTVNLLEYCKQHRAGFILLSTSRVYSIAPLAGLPVVAEHGAFRPDPRPPLPPGLTANGLDETVSTLAPISLYGATKLASETMALEYGESFNFPVFINRCGVLAGAGQFGRPDQGIFAFWINSWLRRRPLSYIGFGGHGHQVRDCLHPRDLMPLLEKQLAAPSAPAS